MENLRVSAGEETSLSGRQVIPDAPWAQRCSRSSLAAGWAGPRHSQLGMQPGQCQGKPCVPSGSAGSPRPVWGWMLTPRSLLRGGGTQTMGVLSRPPWMVLRRRCSVVRAQHPNPPRKGFCRARWKLPVLGESCSAPPARLRSAVLCQPLDGPSCAGLAGRKIRQEKDDAHWRPGKMREMCHAG